MIRSLGGDEELVRDDLRREPSCGQLEHLDLTTGESPRASDLGGRWGTVSSGGEDGVGGAMVEATLSAHVAQLAGRMIRGQSRTVRPVAREGDVHIHCCEQVRRRRPGFPANALVVPGTVNALMMGGRNGVEGGEGR